MRRINLVVFLVIVILFMLSCVSTPTSYDTAQIPDNGKNLRVGVSGQIGEGRYPVGYGFSYYNIRYRKVRGDLQAGYGIKKFVENGANVGIAVGNYSEDDNSRHYLQTDIYIYTKVGIPTDPIRFSLKHSLGGALTESPPDVRAVPLMYTDLLFGIGSPEFLTMGLRIDYRAENSFMLILSSHISSFTISFMYGYYNKYYEHEWSKDIYFGIGKAF